MKSYMLRRATPADWPQISRLLAAAKLPLAGAQEHLSGFLLAVRNGTILGAGALEYYGEAALLRSVAVVAPGRGRGIGTELVRRLLDQARARGVRQVVLLTTTAADYFPRFGFRPVSRDAVPAAVQASAEFQGACPDSATVMLLDL